jgi:hypothetical protein
MRTNIEISDHHRRVLRVLPAQRGLRGYSKIIEEALAKYIEDQVRDPDTNEKVLAMRGSWQKDETERTRAYLTKLREQWEDSSQLAAM